ncbi:hypothetical protein I302_103755 [Kwoniella bestiolae CBS 10118]|uniref:Sm domain-containing protein n=1 Tax=Kwoniella bestiolae CBS 10118 TaxID=1296100 RepID=A0A1B9G992_9TREE|nr:hypothetical protein I302_02458 [Kwoniella bestiolae CBS 10118]OCF27615.1 hypothetical protein I302_02458 [Kwoniella bestiolae CBS 10118]
MAVPLPPPPPTESSNIDEILISTSTDVKLTNPLLIATCTTPTNTNTNTSTQTNTNPDPKPTLHSLLNQLLTITLKDNRTIIGHLLCVDHNQNIILRDAEEFKPFYPHSHPQMTQEEKERWDEVRRNREEYWPRSEPLPVHCTDRGWGGRGVGMVCIRGRDVGRIEVGREVWRGLGGEVDK